MLEEVWRISADIGVELRRSSAKAKGALAHDCISFATPARTASPFLRSYPGVRPSPRQTAAGLNKIIDLFGGAHFDPATDTRVTPDPGAARAVPTGDAARLTL